jgi:hypothetical protein
MSAIAGEDLIRFAEVPDLVPARVSTVTVARWARVGVRGVKLETIRVGGKVLTSREAVERFLAAMNGGRPVAAAS